MYSIYDVFPEHMRDMPEFRSFEKAVNRQIEKLNQRIEEMRDNLLITTARESGIADRESILGITPLPTDTLEERRYRVLLRWYDTYPYTERDLRARLDRLCGKGAYKLQLDKKRNTIACLMPLASLKLLRETWNLLDELLSLNVALRVGLCRSLSHATYSGGAVVTKRTYRVPVTVTLMQREASQTTYSGGAVAITKQYRVKEV